MARWILAVLEDMGPRVCGVTEDSISLFRAPCSRGSNGFGGHSLQHLLVHISELLDVNAALASGVLAELFEHRLGVAGRVHAIQHICRLTRRKTDQRHIAFTPALVFV